MSPLKFDSSFELEDFSIDQKTISIELSFPLYENRKYTKIAFEGLENHLNCSFPNYDDQYNKWTKNISNDCREVFKADLSWEKIKRDCKFHRYAETQANMFANMLLVPREKLFLKKKSLLEDKKNELREFKLEDEEMLNSFLAIHLSREFDVSEDVMIVALCNLKADLTY
jgi:hypothetical protein